MTPRYLRRPLSAVLGIERVDLTLLSVDEVSLRMRRMPRCEKTPWVGEVEIYFATYRRHGREDGAKDQESGSAHAGRNLRHSG